MSFEAEMKKAIAVANRRDVVNLLAKYPNGLRKRMISSYTGIWVGDLVGVMADLEKDGAVVSRLVTDFANMESYDVYTLKK
jgi:hypothetical protein